MTWHVKNTSLDGKEICDIKLSHMSLEKMFFIYLDKKCLFLCDACLIAIHILILFFLCIILWKAIYLLLYRLKWEATWKDMQGGISLIYIIVVLKGFVNVRTYILSLEG
jgi:hypothetical protein